VNPSGVIAGLDPAIHPLWETLLRRLMDTRVKPAYDDLGVNPSLILFANFDAAAVVIGRGFVSDV
jgi:hypothetical protein